MVDLITTLGISLIISMLVTPLIIKIAEKHGIYDLPNTRSIHYKRTPLLGGISFYIAILFTIIFLSKENNMIKLILALGLTVIEIMSIIDDIKHISVKCRLIVLTIIAIFTYIIFKNYYECWNTINGFILIAIILWIVGITNSINLIDGMDGLASYLSVISFLSFSIIFSLQNNTGFALAICLSALGAILGFIPYNRHKAMIFMGDAGSILLGYILSFLSIIIVANIGTIRSIIIPIFILFVPIMDMITSVVRRLMFSQSIFRPDMMHFHHLLNRIIKNHLFVIISLTIIQIIFSLFGLMIFIYELYVFGWIAFSSIFIISTIIFIKIYQRLNRKYKQKP